MRVRQEMSSSRIVIKNSLISVGAQTASMVMGFICHRFFLQYLGLEIVGTNSVITETLGMLTFAELGIGTAISYRLYEPLVKKDIKQLSVLMGLYRKVYTIIGVVVLAVGLIIMLFLPIFINDASLKMGYIYVAYMIQLSATASSYFFAYKRALIFVDQKQFICKLVDIGCNIVFSVFRIISLVIFQNFHIYLLLQLIQTLTGNTILGYYCNKNYPFIKEKISDKFKDIRGMFKDTKNILMGKIAGYVYSSTDNLVISTFSGITVAGGFTNYKYVTNAVKNLTYSVTDSIVATIGNNIQSRDREENYELFKKYTFIRYVMANIVVTGMCICTDSFVGLMFGEQYRMHGSILYLIAVDIYIGIVYGPICEYIVVLGYFMHEKYINIVGALLNLGISVLLVNKWGISGVLIGTVISQCFFWVGKSILLHKKYFKGSDKFKKIWIQYICYTLLTGVQVAVLHAAKQNIEETGHKLLVFMGEGMVSIAVSVVMITIFFRKTQEYQYLIDLIKGMLYKFTGNKKEGEQC